MTATEPHQRATEAAQLLRKLAQEVHGRDSDALNSLAEWLTVQANDACGCGACPGWGTNRFLDRLLEERHLCRNCYTKHPGTCTTTGKVYS